MSPSRSSSRPSATVRFACRHGVRSPAPIPRPKQANSARANITPPFFPGVNKPRAGQKYSVVGLQGRESVFGEVVNRTDDHHRPMVAVTGVGFPQDLRNCEVCHGGAAQSQQRFSDVSRRTCQGCHTDAWFGDPAVIASDDVHYMHPGDTQTDDHNCIGCHHNIEYCVMCHTPDGTDWSRRPKGADGNVDPSRTADDIEERSIHFKRMVHAIHTGGRSGSAELDTARPFVVYGFGGTPNFFDDVRFPGTLANCTLCHVNASYAIESVPPTARPTIANETASIQHRATAAHAATEPSTPRLEAACFGCHDTGAARLHAQQMTGIAGPEPCGQCHGLNTSFLGVKAAHGVL